MQETLSTIFHRLLDPTNQKPKDSSKSVSKTGSSSLSTMASPLFSLLQWRETPRPSHTHWEPGFHPSLVLLSGPLHLIGYQAPHILLLKYFSKPRPSLYPYCPILAQILLISPLYHYGILPRLFSESMHRTPASVLNTFSPLTLWILVTTVCRGSQPLVIANSFATPQTVAHQAPLSMGFSRQEYWSGLPFPSPGELPDPGIEPASPALQADSLPSDPLGKLTHSKCPLKTWVKDWMNRKMHSPSCIHPDPNFYEDLPLPLSEALENSQQSFLPMKTTAGPSPAAQR